MAQSVEHVLGKDGVGSSNLPISSKQTPPHYGMAFCFRLSALPPPRTQPRTLIHGDPEMLCILGKRSDPASIQRRCLCIDADVGHRDARTGSAVQICLSAPAKSTVSRLAFFVAGELYFQVQHPIKRRVHTKTAV